MAHCGEVSLSGIWRFRCDPDELGEHFPQQLDVPWRFDSRWMDFLHNDTEWEKIRVPSCWQEEGYGYNGAAWYRNRFVSPASSRGNERMWLRFDGVDYYADVWLNERYLGSHEGYFSAFQFETTPYLKPEPNLLVVRVDSPNDIRAKERQRGQLKSLIKGALQRWDANNPEVNPGGIWGDVKVITTGPGAILSTTAVTSIPRLPGMSNLGEQVPATAVVSTRVAAFEPAFRHSTVWLGVRLRPVNFEGPTVETRNRIQPLPQPCVWTATIDVEEARLWYTWDLGTPNLYEVEVWLEVDGEISDAIQQTFGFRQIERGIGWETYLNGVRLFQRGANYLSDQLLSTMSEDRYEADLQLFREANLNTLHAFAVVEKHSLYDMCDRLGILVYQDFPAWLAMDNSSDLVRRATLQLEELVTQFGHHPCIGVWNFGSQPSVANFRKLASALAARAKELDPSRIVNQANAIFHPFVENPDPVEDFAWNRGTFEDFRRDYDWRMDTHQYYGWYVGTLEDLKREPIANLELVSEFGAQALPSKEMLASIVPSKALFPPDWTYYTRRCFQPKQQFTFISQPSSLDQFVRDSQAYQARFIKFHTEYYRRLKFRPCNGAHLFSFNDCWPAITWSVVDYARERKEGFFALRRAMSPVQALLEFPQRLDKGGIGETDVWIVNDFPRSFDSLNLTWSMVDVDTGDIVDQGMMLCRVAANVVELAGKLRWHVDKGSQCKMHLQLMEGETPIADNEYGLSINAVGEVTLEF